METFWYRLTWCAENTPWRLAPPWVNNREPPGDEPPVDEYTPENTSSVLAK